MLEYVPRPGLILCQEGNFSFLGTLYSVYICDEHMLMGT